MRPAVARPVRAILAMCVKRPHRQLGRLTCADMRQPPSKELAIGGAPALLGGCPSRLRSSAAGGLQAGEVPAEISFLMLGLLEQMAVHHGVVIGGHAA
jgi:hypothetical protein